MKKKNFVSMMMGTIGGILFAMGMCMALLEQWGASSQGVVVGGVGLAVLLAMIIVRRKMEGKPAIAINGKTIGMVLLGIVGSLGLGVGMCMVMVWGMLIPGVLVGIIGIIVLLLLIPIYKGIQV